MGPRRAYLVGYLGHMINALAKNLDFRYNILEGTSFGIKASNGSYDGVIGHIERKVRECVSAGGCECVGGLVKLVYE